jgi:hypothetical protein
MGRRSDATDQPAKNMERYEARSSRIEGLAISIRDIIRMALRKRPDRIIVGEVRGPEALDMLNAMNTGHRGCMSTIHANNTSDMIIRLENMVLEANSALPLSAAQRLIVAGINIAVQVVKFADNRRRITEITEIESYDSATNQINLRPIFEYRPGAPDPYVFLNLPSDKVRKLIEEYLMKSGRHRRRWDKPVEIDEVRGILKGIFRRHLEVHFQPWMMKGREPAEKSAIFVAAMDWLAAEVFNPENVLIIKNGGNDREKKDESADECRVEYSDVVDNDFLVHLHAEARLKLASRLNLPLELLGELVRREAVSQESWIQLFTPTAPLPGRKAPIKTCAAAIAEGFDLDDIRFAFFSRIAIQAGLTGSYMAEEESSVANKVVTLQPLIPYLNIQAS